MKEGVLKALGSLETGAGGFVSTFQGPRDRDSYTVTFHVHAHTWVHQDMLSDERISEPGAGERLGSTVLLPIPLRHLWAAA